MGEVQLVYAGMGAARAVFRALIVLVDLRPDIVDVVAACRLASGKLFFGGVGAGNVLAERRMALGAALGVEPHEGGRAERAERAAGGDV